MISKVDRAKVTVHYMGFRVSDRAREYTFEVRQEKIRRELATFANDPLRSEYTVTDLELTEYRDAHAPRSFVRFHPPKPAPGMQAPLVVAESSTERYGTNTRHARQP
jgi:hypothetical protein